MTPYEAGSTMYWQTRKHSFYWTRRVGPRGKGTDSRFTYAVAERGTRAYPVIVIASDYLEAFERARADARIASLGSDVSAVRLTATGLGEALSNGAQDLRNQSADLERP